MNIISILYQSVVVPVHTGEKKENILICFKGIFVLKLVTLHRIIHKKYQKKMKGGKIQKKSNPIKVIPFF